MAVEAETSIRAPIALSFSANLAIALVLFLLGSGSILAFHSHDPALHTVLDTSVALTGALIALLLWEVSRRGDESWPLFLTISFATLAVGELVHVVAVLGWLGGGTTADVRLRAGTWGPPAHLLVIGVGASLLLRRRPRRVVLPFAAALLLLSIALVAVFLTVPRYSEPGLLGITRPTLISVPLLWSAVAYGYWKCRRESEIARAIAPTAIFLIIAHCAILYSRAPSDSFAMVAHLGKFVGEALLLFNLTQIGAADTARRREAERALMALNQELDARVAERTAAERRSQDLIEAIITNSPAVIYVKDLAGSYLMVNQRYADIFGVDREAMVGRTDYDLFERAEADIFRAMDARVAKVGRPLTEEEMASVDGEARIFLSVKSPLRDQAGQIYAVFGISTDITEHRRAESALGESERRNQLVVESALDGVVTIDGAGVITAWNPQAERTFGWAEAEVLGRSVDEILMPERYRPAHRAGMERYLSTGEAHVLGQRIELEGLHRNGQEFPVELAITPIRMGEATTFTAFVRDITDRKIAGARLQSQLDRLHLLEQITRAVGQRQDVHSIFQVVVRTLEDRLPADFACICRYDRVSHGLTVAHVGVGSAPLGEELGITENASISLDGNGLSRCVAGELVYEPDIAEVRFAFPSRLAARGLRSLVVAPLQFESEVFGVLVVSRCDAGAFSSGDCEFLRQLAEHVGLAAHQAQLRDSLQQAYDDLKHTQQAVIEQERLRAIGQMASGIAHDINNAISPISIYTQSLVERNLEVPSEVRDYLELVGRVIKDVAATVARMRDFYRPDADTELEPLDLNTLIPQIVELTRARWSDMPQQRGAVVTVSTQLEADLPRIMGNAAELREAMTNLIFNAVDAMPEGGAITVRTETRPAAPGSKPRVRLEVGDTGAGMDQETRERCLEPFFTTKGERGTGLGLAMVKGAAQRHKAVLDIDSAPGTGTRMRLEFATVGKIRPAKPQSAMRNGERTFRLLLVDDDPAVLRSTQTVLEIRGHAITAADGGQAGIDALRVARDKGERFDLVVTDLGMPYVDGNQVSQAVKELFPETPVVLLTGWGRRMPTGGDAPAHVDFVLPKPLDLDELREIFDRLP
ncbi:PAS domain S-box protein [Sphingomonas kyeonggiensis]|uniref:histidine kinase n=1 Tax=Sphingomonas kyeonggiensis TaxID=1268553 RepID=A0A7W6NZ48_9SPHN|nr:PAS domain S-box protein [Sphingomonas kyeonggiensis]MBB4100446.1 PAS domain S-box-containing protein [Sphingomonas kyeonggiensis]